MSPAQQKQHDWVKAQLARGKPVVEYACPACDEPNFSRVPAPRRTVIALAVCPHCGGTHVRSAPDIGRVEASELAN